MDFWERLFARAGRRKPEPSAEAKCAEEWDTELTKYIKQRLSVKIFIITFFLLGTACSGTYFFISKLFSRIAPSIKAISTGWTCPK